MIPHFAFDFGFWRQRCHRVDHQHVDTAGTHQHVGNFQGLLTGIRLGNQQIGDIHAKFLCITNIQRMFRINKGGDATDILHFGNHLQRQRGLAGRFRAIDFHDTPARQAADTKRNVQPQRASRH